MRRTFLNPVVYGGILVLFAALLTACSTKKRPFEAEEYTQNVYFRCFDELTTEQKTVLRREAFSRRGFRLLELCRSQFFSSIQSSSRPQSILEIIPSSQRLEVALVDKDLKEPRALTRSGSDWRDLVFLETSAQLLFEFFEVSQPRWGFCIESFSRGLREEKQSISSALSSSQKLWEVSATEASQRYEDLCFDIGRKNRESWTKDQTETVYLAYSRNPLIRSRIIRIAKIEKEKLTQASRMIELRSGNY